MSKDLHTTDVVDRLLPAVEASAQTFALLKMFADIAMARHNTFATLVEEAEVPDFQLQLAAICEFQANCLLACGFIAKILHAHSPVFPPHDKLPLVKAALHQPIPKDLRHS